MKHFKSKISSYKTSKDGVAAMEFVLIAPVMIAFFVGLIEVSTYMYAKQKLDSAAHNVLNLITAYENLSNDQLKTITDIFPSVTEPLSVGENYSVIISAVQQDVDVGEDVLEKPYALWQVSHGNSGLGGSVIDYKPRATNEENQIDPKTLGDFDFVPGDQIIVVEAHIKYSPVLFKNGSYVSDKLYQRISGRPRKGSYQFKPSEIR